MEYVFDAAAAGARLTRLSLESGFDLEFWPASFQRQLLIFFAFSSTLALSNTQNKSNGLARGDRRLGKLISREQQFQRNFPI